MRNRVARAEALLGVAALVLLAAGPCEAAGAGQVNLFGGIKSLDDSVWEPAESQPEFGVEISVGGAGWPVMIAIDGFMSEDEADEGALTRTGSTRELALGVRKIWQKGRVHPYIGGGLNHIEAEVETDAPPPPATPGLNFFPEPDPDGGTTSDSDSGFGAWAGGGIFWRLGPYVNLGVSVRLSGANVEFRDEEAQAGGLHAGVLLGFGWPAAK
ncbi:MAG: hypothetical protein ACREAA_07935 [Candidatus Polarisedimenticolia bacterium]